METQDHLSTWRKVGIVVIGLMIAPLALFVVFVTALSLFPLLLLGRFEGSLGKAPLEHEIGRVVHDVQKRTEAFYAA